MGNDKQLDMAVTFGSNRNGLRETQSLDLCFVRKQYNLARECMVKKQHSLAAQGGWRFCMRHGIRNLSLQDEKLSADKEAADGFIPSFLTLIEEENLSLEQKIAMKHASIIDSYQRRH